MDIGKDRITIIKQDSGMNPLAALSEACKYLMIFEEWEVLRANGLINSPGPQDEERTD